VHRGKNIVNAPTAKPWRRSLALAAAFTLAVTLAWRIATPLIKRSAWLSRPPLGTVERSSGGTLTVEHASLHLAAGDPVRAGSYKLDRGLINLVFENGAQVVVEAPARFRIDSPKQLLLQLGRLSANVPPAAKGFTVQTPEADVIDHGTEFGVEVKEGFGSEVHVFEGEVEVKSRTVENDTVRLFTDQATRIDDVAGLSAGIEVARDRFMLSFDEPADNYARRIRDLNPVFFYRMQPSSDGLTLTDQSGNRIDARIEAGETDRPLFAKGRHGSALRLRGPRAGSHAVVADYPKTTNQLSVVAWVRADSRPRWASIAKNWGEGRIGQFHFGLFDHTGELEILVKGPRRGGARVRDTTPFPIGSWQHVAFVADGETLRLYRNGREVGSARHRAIGSPTIQSLGIGAKLIGNHPKRPGEPSDFWHGKIDELALFNRALDSDTILELHGINEKRRLARDR